MNSQILTILGTLLADVEALAAGRVVSIDLGSEALAGRQFRQTLAASYAGGKIGLTLTLVQE